MTLERKILIGINLLSVLLTMSLVFISVTYARNQILMQLQYMAQEKATALAAGLLQFPEPIDEQSVQALLKDASATQLFSNLSLREAGGVWVEVATESAGMNLAPRWFARLVSAEDIPGTAVVASSDHTRGVVEAVASTKNMARPLWEMFLDQIAIAIIVITCINALTVLFLRRWLWPLRLLEEQANALDFEQLLLLENLPSMPELQRVVIAVNRLVNKLKSNYDHQVQLSIKLRGEASIDPTTGIANRREFDSRLAAWLTSEKGGSPGALILAHISPLSKYNDKHGREAGDKLLLEIAGRLEKELRLWPDGLVAKRSGSDFVLFAPGLLQEEVGEYLAGLCAELSSLDFVNSGDVVISLGCAVSKSVASVTRMLSAADAALRLSRSCGAADWAVYPVDDPMLDIRPASEWQSFLAMLIEQKQLQLYFQPVLGCDREMLHNEVYSRVQDGAVIVHAGTFWPLAERYGLVAQLDRQVIEKAFDTLQMHPLVCLSVNLSSGSLSSDGFLGWLETACLARASLVKRLTFEFNEAVLVKNRKQVEKLCEIAKKCGFSLALDHFGIHPAAVGIIRALHLAYVKVDRSYTHNISDVPENQFYLSTLVQIAQACDVRILVDGVETEAEWQFLSKLGTEGGQGFYLGQPVPTPVDG
ncbi:diguanylate cyclase (GGDEF)-like protein [Alteromonadaceae bacterium 2753L.S.0a.02]|nr:diguanylate cyclase (GGDEF)-like protein [Alteromonadaceae bacterium 2753L.S.0a.02]